MNKFIKYILFLSIIMFLFSSCSLKKEDIDILNEGVIGDKIEVNRAIVSKMLSLAFYTKDEIKNMEDVINFEDVDKNKWYYKYINSAYIKGDMKGVLENKFMPNEPLTLIQTQYLIDKYNKNIKIKINDENKDKPISYALWCDIYTQLIKDIESNELVVVATSNENENLKEGYAITDKGLFSFEGFEAHKYLNMKIKVLTKGNEVVAITEVLETSPTLERIFIKNVKNDYIEVLIGGVILNLNYENLDISQEDINSIADIKIDNEKITSIKIYKNFVQAKANKITDKNIRLNNTNYVLDENFKVYSNLNGEVKFKDKESIIIGESIASFFVGLNENKVYAAVINENPKFQEVRVLISNINGYNFENISLSSEGGLKLTVKGKEKIFKENETLNIKNNNDFNIGENEIIIVEPLKSEFKIKFLNLKRNYKNPSFSGKIEICKVGNYYNIINQVNTEDYIKGVSSSNNFEYSKEVLKSLSVIYRTTAISLILENNFAKYGANLDDSSKSQIYNHFSLNENIEKAVEETKGKIITYNLMPIKPNFFAFSGGATSNSGEVWADKRFNTFPTDTKPYLKSKNLFENFIYDNISDEINANIFFKSKDIESIEKDSKWFRWSASSHLEYLKSNFKKFYDKYKNFIKVLSENEFIYKEISELGNIKDITIEERGASGNVMKIKIIGEKETILLSTDMVIKEVFNIDYVVNNFGEKENNITKLPSSNFVIDKVYDSQGLLQKVNFYGGGYGHGVGLSLYASEKMAQSSKTYEEILKYFYENIEIKNIN